MAKNLLCKYPLLIWGLAILFSLSIYLPTNQALAESGESTTSVQAGSSALIQTKATNTSFSTATNLPLQTVKTGSVSSSQPAIYYSFTLSQSGTVTLDASIGVNKSKISLYNASQTFVASDLPTWNQSFGKSSSTKSWNLLGGKYYLKLERLSTSTGTSGTTSIKIAFTPSNETGVETQSKNNNSTATATPVSINSQITGFMATNDSKDYYKFTIPSSGRISLSGSNYIRMYCSVISAKTGKTIGSWYNNSFNETISFAGPHDYMDLAKGTYYLYVNNTSGFSGVYTMTINFTAAPESFAESDGGTNNTSSTASAISLDKVYNGHIAVNDTQDFYRFTLSSKANINLLLAASYGTGYFRIYDTSGKILAYSNSKQYYGEGCIGDMDSPVLDWQYKNINMGAFNPGTYYFAVEIRETTPRGSGSGVSNAKERYDTGNYRFILHTKHDFATQTLPASFSNNGSTYTVCACGERKGSTTTIPQLKSLKLSASSFVYSGKAKVPKIVVKDTKGKVVSSSNYSIIYGGDRKSVGTQTIRIVFKGKYSGTVTKSYKINPKATSITKLSAKSKGFVVKFKKQRTQTSGYQVQYAKNKKFSSKKTKTIKNTKTAKLTVSKLKNNTQYYVRIRTYSKVDGKTYYSKWSKVKTVYTK